MVQPDPTELGVVGVILVVLFWVLHFTSRMLLAKKGVVSRTDPSIAHLIEELHAMTVNTEKQKNQGNFNCVWRGRDEVRDLMDTMRRMVTAVEANTLELRRTNGGHKS